MGQVCTAAPALSFLPSLQFANVYELSGWFWFRHCELAQLQTKASFWASAKHAHESALSCGWSIGQAEYKTGSRGCEGWAGLAPGGAHILAAPDDCKIFAPDYLPRNIPSQSAMTVD